MSQLTTHVLDTSLGKPVQDVTVILFAWQNSDWQEMARGITNADGRITGLLDKQHLLQPGNYKLMFETGRYFDKRSVATFYPYVEIVFHIAGFEHYHVPLLINPFGYSTYRGS